MWWDVFKEGLGRFRSLFPFCWVSGRLTVAAVLAVRGSRVAELLLQLNDLLDALLLDGLEVRLGSLALLKGGLHIEELVGAKEGAEVLDAEGGVTVERHGESISSVYNSGILVQKDVVCLTSSVQFRMERREEKESGTGLEEKEEGQEEFGSCQADILRDPVCPVEGDSILYSWRRGLVPLLLLLSSPPLRVKPSAAPPPLSPHSVRLGVGFVLTTARITLAGLGEGEFVLGVLP